MGLHIPSWLDGDFTPALARGAGTGRTGLCRRTGGLESRAGTIRPGWILTLARQMRGSGM